MAWVLLFIIGAATLTFLFILLTEGKYFGKGLMHRIYDQVGPVMFGARTEAEQWRRFVDRLGLRGDERILDVGTATGELPLALAATIGFFGEVVGVDWSQRMMEVAADTAAGRGLDERVTFQVADLRAGLPFDDGEFDVVFCLGLLETMPSPERALRELRRVLVQEGMMVLSLYRGALSSRIAALSLDWYEQHLLPLGLGDVKVATCRRSQDVVVARPSPSAEGVWPGATEPLGGAQGDREGPAGPELAFEAMDESDIPVLTHVMRRAFDDDAQKHFGRERGGPPGYDDGEFFRKWLLPYEQSVGYKVRSGGEVVGGIIVWILPKGDNILGTMFIDPDYQDRGVGEKTWRFIEARYPESASWRLQTPTRATKNHHFYAKCGFEQVESDPLIPTEDGMTIYRKEMGDSLQPLAESPVRRRPEPVEASRRSEPGRPG